MYRFISKQTILFTFAAAALVCLSFSCTQRSVSSHSEPSVSLSMVLTEPGLMQFVDQFRLIVTARDMERIETSLTYRDGFLEGEVQVPSGNDRTFTALALDVARGDTIYRGETTLDVISGETITLTINMYPQVPLIKLSPRFQKVAAYSHFTADVKVYMIDSLYGISFRILFDNTGVVLPDSAVAANTNVLFVDTLDSGTGYYAFGVTQVDSTTPLVDAEGDATLARIYFQSLQPELDIDTAELQIQVTGLTKIVNSVPVDVPFDDVYTDQAKIEVSIPDTLVTFRDPQLEQAVRDALEKPIGPITITDAQSLTTLFADSRQISELGGLSKLRNLQLLNLELNQITDIGELGSLTNLTQLFLGWNNISDISPLAGKPSIFELDLRNNQITDIHSLYDFYPNNNTLGEPFNLTDKVWLLGNPLADTAQVSDTLCFISVGVFLTSPDTNWCSQ
jgi:hypothetical protein